MKERPILFSAPMIRALLAGTKTQTRRVCKQAGGLSFSVDCEDGIAEMSWLHGDGPGYDVHETIKRVPCPYGVPGDRLWVKETHLYVGPGSGSDLPSYREERAKREHHKPENCWYRADGDRDVVWTPSIHMFRGLSRITIEVTDVRVERLQDISEADAKAEGVERHRPATIVDRAYRVPYQTLWGSINGAGSWDANLWVWAISFRRL